MKYPLVLAEFYSQRWALLPDWYANIERILLERSAGQPLDDDTRAALSAKSYGGEVARQADKVALLQVYGTIVPRADMFSEMSALSSHQGIAQMLRTAADDESVREIIVDFDSPGGAVSGIDVSVEAMRYAASKKPVTVVTEGLLASAAYWIGAQATRIVAAPTAGVGSISIIAEHHDITEAQKQLGVKTTVLTTGKWKALGHPTEPLTDEGKDKLMSELLEVHDLFVADIAQGRGVAADSAQNRWADGSVWIGQRALESGLVDEIGTLQSVMDSMTKPLATRKGRRASREMSPAIKSVLEVLENGPWQGAEKDEPEGKRYLTMSATLAKQMAQELRKEYRMDLEQLKAEHPELYAQIIAQGKVEGKTEAQTQAAANQSGSDLEREVVRLRAAVETQQEETRAEKRKNIAANALEAADLPKQGKVGERDLDASFRAYVEGLALEATSDDEAKSKVDEAITDRRLLIGEKKGDDKKRRAFLPSGDTSREERPQPQGDEVARARRSIGL
jgi:signal peptide peptidase SppA